MKKLIFIFLAILSGIYIWLSQLFPVVWPKDLKDWLTHALFARSSQTRTVSKFYLNHFITKQCAYQDSAGSSLDAIVTMCSDSLQRSPLSEIESCRRWLKICHENGVSLTTSNGKYPPILWAIKLGSPEMISVLIEIAPNILITRQEGLTPLEHAQQTLVNVESDADKKRFLRSVQILEGAEKLTK